MRSWSLVLLFVFATALSGCAAVFRESRPTVHFESEPSAADLRLGSDTPGKTPANYPVKRKGITTVRIEKAGFEAHNGSVRKKINGGWITLDVLTCVFPVLLCVPLIVDAATGAWFDVSEEYRAKLEPAAPPPAPVPTTTASAAPPPPTMSESERKAAARAAYIEGMQLQEKGNAAEALSRFEAAQKLFDAPTHLLRIGQTQATTGRLVEAQETYESLTRRELPAGSPDAFRDAQDAGRKELEKLKTRIPTLRILVQPAPSSLKNLVVQVDGRAVPNELVGIARPVNPGSYRITASAAGYRAAGPTTVDVKEGKSESVELRLVK